MYAILYSSAGAPDVLQWREVPTPQVVAGEVLIKVFAAGINRADILQRQGQYPPPPGASDILGLEVAGEIAAVGDGVARWKIGDKVCALLAGGGYAEFVAVPAGQCLLIPDGISMREAAALPEAVATVWANLFEAGALKAGEVVLVHGGSSGIGTTAIQLAKLAGAKIFVSVGREEKAEACRALGADLVINYASEDFVAAVLKATGNKGVDVVLDMVGGDYINRNLTALASFGRHVSIATQAGRVAGVDFRLIMQKRLVITGSTLRARPIEEKARLIAEIEKKAWVWVAERRLKPLIRHFYPIKSVVEAHKMMESGKQIGKMVLEVAF
jgi:putative PIG3 family NAD(P)H quinone oxidoreductase